MIQHFKYKKSNQNEKKKIVFIVSFLISLYVGLAQNVATTIVNTACSSIDLNFGQSKTYRVFVNHQNVLFVSTDIGIFQFDGNDWIKIPVKGNPLMAEDLENNMFIANSFFLGKINYDKNPIVVDTVIIPVVLQNWKQPVSAYAINRGLYLCDGQKFWIYSNHSLNDEDSSAFRLSIFKGRDCIYQVNNEQKVVKRLSENKTEVFSNLNFLSGKELLDDLEDGNEFLWAKIKDKAGLLKLDKTTLSPMGVVHIKEIQWEKYLKSFEICPGKLVICCKNSMLHIVDIKSGESQLISFGLSHMADLTDALLDNNGSLWLVYPNKLCRIDFSWPGELQKGDRKFSVILTRVMLEADSVLYRYSPHAQKNKATLELNPSTRVISFLFTSTEFANSEAIKYATMLEGFDQKWSDWQNNKAVVYCNLPRGNYTFKVKARNGQGKVGQEATFTFTIKAPIYIRTWAWVVYITFSLLIILLYVQRRRRNYQKEKSKLEDMISQRTAELRREKAKTDELLANLLPKDTADELKNTGKATSQKFNMVTVLFSDIQGFSKIAEQMNPEKLIDELDSFFFHFDSVADKYNIEKIKTIGDAYMCAGGIPYKNRTNPVEVVLAALEMQEYMKQLKLKNNNIWDLRIGIHTGAVIAGVVGHKRYSYDIWGDTVNTASRMESSGEAGKVNISGHTYELVKEFFVCENRGKMPVKYKGDIDMYFVKGIRPELSVDLKVVPNKKFFLQLQSLRLLDLEEFVLDKLNNELPKNLYFHNARYTKDTYTQVELIGRAEGASPEELLILRTAALFLNTGFITNYSDYIHASKKFAKEILPKFNYTDDQIKSVTELIHSTQRVFNLSNRLETILIDASLNYLGRVDFYEHSLNRFKEMKERNSSISETEWFTQQQKLLEQFTFYTNTAKLLREVSVQEQVQKLRENGKLNS